MERGTNTESLVHSPLRKEQNAPSLGFACEARAPCVHRRPYEDDRRTDTLALLPTVPTHPCDFFTLSLYDSHQLSERRFTALWVLTL